MNRDLVEKLFPICRYMILFMNVARVPILLFSLWKPSICHYFYYYQLFLTIAKETLPVDVGQLWRIQMKIELLFWHLCYTVSDTRFELPTWALLTGYINFFVRY